MAKLAPHQDATLIRASAGTGKTFQLSTRLLQLLASGQSIDRILATTFTRKAAGEILDRVLERLAEAIHKPAKLEELNSNLTGVSLDRSACESLLKKVTAQLHRLRISTLDSFFSQLARAFAFELELPGGWQLMDPLREHAVRQNAIQALLDQHDRNSLRTMLNLLGKGEYTAGILREIENTVENGASLAEITPASAWENPEVIAAPGDSNLENALLTLVPNDVFNKSLNKALTKLQEEVAAGNWEEIASLTIISAATSPTPKYQNSLIPEHVVDSLLVVRRQAIHVALTVYRSQTTSSRELLESYLTYLDAHKRQIREWTFDDVSRKLAGWLNAAGLNPESLGFRLDFAIDHLLLDEFQDTSLIQWEVLRPFAKSIDQRRKQNPCSFFCVGDTKQAIYGWRGGIAELFNEVEHSLKDLNTIYLKESRRSSQIVLDAVNQVFQNLNQHSAFGRGEPEAMQWLQEFKTHKSHYPEMPGYVRLFQGTVEQGLSTADNRLALLGKAASDIADIAKAYPFGSIGVLVRTNDEVGLMIDLLRKYELDVSQEGGNPLTDSAAVEVMLSLLTLADHPGNSVALFHLRNSPLATKLPPDWLQSAGELSYHLRIDLSTLGLGGFLIKYCDLLANSCNQRDQLRLEQLIQQGFGFPLSQHSRITAFVDFIRSQKVALPQPAQIRVMNIHQSKGLEFDSVFLPNLNDSLTGQTPLFVAKRKHPTERPDGVVRYIKSAVQESLDKDWQEAFRRDAGLKVSESLCLLYVAMTRAKHGLYMYVNPNSKNDKATMGSLLQTTIANRDLIASGNTMSFEAGDPQWYLKLSANKPISDSALPKKVVQPTLFDDEDELPSLALNNNKRVNKRVTSDLLYRRQALDESIAPSGLVAEVVTSQVERGSSGAMLKPVSLLGSQTTVAALEGTIEHAWFAKLTWEQDTRAVEESYREIAAAAIDRQHWGMVDVEVLWKRWLKHLKHAKIKSLLNPARYAGKISSNGFLKLETEKRFATIIRRRLIQGSVDRLVLAVEDDQIRYAEIIDFKSDYCPNKKETASWIHEQVDKYKPQLAAYAEVVAKTYQLSRSQIRTTLALLDVGEVCDVSANV